MSFAIRVDNLGKRYQLGMTHAGSIRELVNRTVRRFVGRRQAALPQGVTKLAGDRTDMEPDGSFWALRDVSFEVKSGEVVGIIGRNGAGKSTLLKILSQITAPTHGRVELHGRVASLLEVGTGFHPELSGRDNVYLNGAILGMTKAEVHRKFDEIVAFAEIEKFIDTPVKRYSSGMYVRLAFAVAAHLEPETLIVDEVLAVGDTAFQKKCLGKIGDVAKQGRTVLLVSHNMAAILNLCTTALLLDRGRKLSHGPSLQSVDQYLKQVNLCVNSSLAEREDREGNGRLRFLDYTLLTETGDVVPQALSGQDVLLAFRYESTSIEPLRSVHIALGIHGRYNEKILHLSTSVSREDFAEVPPRGMLVCRILNLPLQPGRYPFNLFACVGGEIADWIQEAGTLEVISGDFFGSGKLPPTEQGYYLAKHVWQVSVL